MQLKRKGMQCVRGNTFLMLLLYTMGYDENTIT